MKYILPKKVAGYSPEVMVILNEIDDDVLFCDNYNLMHPYDVYCSVFEDAVESGIRLTRDVIEVHKRRVNGVSDSELDLSIKNGIFHFLFSMANFLDGCQSIIKSLFENTKSKEFTKLSREFTNSIKEYNDYLRKSVNYIKHRHRVVRTVYGAWDNNLIVGYYIEGVVASGVLGPDPDIHNESNCAISLNRDIPYHLCNLFAVSAALASLVKRKLKNRNSDVIINNKQDDRVLKFIDYVSCLPRTFFPDELKMKWPEVCLNAKNRSAKLLYPSDRKPENMKVHNMEISLSSTIRSRSRTLKLPYFGQENHYLNANKSLQLKKR
ncbi:hypothetical protein [Halomonas citrativorans]|uniref:Uncharacterized protein n=1 Tax=Halomonas citrativorans TaxID=2742612 RepID=A0ABR9FBZ6_9GAMM|nr:hypothetical protein [Halomonas citrativorans]MBE0403964.1 hypothetical protein [Halomonas citrativorans]